MVRLADSDEPLQQTRKGAEGREARFGKCEQGVPACFSSTSPLVSYKGAAAAHGRGATGGLRSGGDAVGDDPDSVLRSPMRRRCASEHVCAPVPLQLLTHEAQNAPCRMRCTDERTRSALSDWSMGSRSMSRRRGRTHASTTVSPPDVRVRGPHGNAT